MYGTPTPDYGAPSDPTAVVGVRIGAWIIDLIIYLGLVFAFTAATGGVEAIAYSDLTWSEAHSLCDRWEEANEGFCFVNQDATSGSETFGETNYTAQTIEGGSAGLLFWTGHLVAYAVIQGLTGGSLGKLAVGLRVVDQSGQVIGIGRSLARTFAWLIDALTCGLPVIGGVAMVSTKGHRRVGDMIAGTYVVKKASVGMPINTSVPVATPSAGWGAPPTPGWPPAGPGSTPMPGAGGSSWSPAGPTSGRPFATTPPASPSGDGPTWDPARNTYIQYDRDLGAWLQWDDGTQTWGPISQ